MTPIKLSFRQKDNRISERDGSQRMFLTARYRHHDAMRITPENFADMKPECQEAYTIEDSGRQFELAGSDNKGVRSALAQNPKLHPDVQLLMCKDSEIGVRNSLSKNPNITELVQLKLSRDKFDVRDSLADNPNLTEAIQLKMINKPKQSESILRAIGENPNLSLEAIKAILPKVSYYRFGDICKNAKTLDKQMYLFEYAKQKSTEDGYRGNPVEEFVKKTEMLPEIKNMILKSVMESTSDSFVSSVLDSIKVDESTLQKIYNRFKGKILNQNSEVMQSLARLTSNPQLQKALFKDGSETYLVRNEKLDKNIALSIIVKTDAHDILNAIADNLGGEESIIDDDIAKAILIKTDDGRHYYGSTPSERVAKRASEAIQKFIIDEAVAKTNNATTEEDKLSKLTETAELLENTRSMSFATEAFVLKYGPGSAKSAVARNSKNPEIHKMILDSNEYGPLANLMKNEHLSPEIKSNMIDTTENMEFLEVAADNSEINPDEANKIYNRAVGILEKVKQRLGEPDPENKGEDVVSDEKYFMRILKNFAGNSKDPQLLGKVAQTKNEDLWGLLAENKYLPQESQKLLVSDDNYNVVQDRIASRKDILPEVQMLLAHSPHFSVKSSLFDNDVVDSHVKDYLKEIMTLGKRFNWLNRWFGEPKTPTADEQKSLVELNDPFLNTKLAQTSNQADILNHLLESKNRQILEAIAANEVAPEEIYKKIYDLNDKELDGRLFENQGTSVSIKELYFDRYAGTDAGQHYKKRLLDQGYASKEMQMKFFEETKGNEVEKGFTRRLEEVFSKLLAIKNLDPEIQKQLAAYKGSFIRAKLAMNPNLSQEVQDILLTDKAFTVRKLMAGNPKISEQTQLTLASDKQEQVRRELVKNKSCSEVVQQKLAIESMRPKLDKYGDEGLTDPEIIERLLNNNKLAPSVQAIFVQSKDIEIIRDLANNENLTKEIQLMLLNNPDKTVRERLSENKNMHPEIRVRLKSTPSEGFNKDEYVVKVHKNKYVFRILEKYMEDNNMTQLASQDFKGKPIERYRQQPLVDAMFKENNGKPLTIEHIKKAIEKIDAKEFYVYHGDFSSGIQSHEKFSNIPRRSFALLFKDLESDPQTLEFMKDIAPQMAHGHHGSMGGWGEMNMGWILWKDISKIVGKPSVLIEQVQSDWRGLMSKIRAMKDDVNHPQNYQAERLVDDWVEKYGEESLPKIQKNLDELVRDYPEKLMATFLSSSGIRGRSVYITGKDTQRELVGHDADKESTMLDVIYDRVPSAFGFKPAEDMPGFLKLERASSKALVRSSGYRKFINQQSVKLGVSSHE